MVDDEARNIRRTIGLDYLLKEKPTAQELENKLARITNVTAWTQNQLRIVAEMAMIALPR